MKAGALRRAALCALALAPVAALRASVAPAAPQASAADLQFFETRIRPVLVDRCYTCHSHDADKIKGGLMLDTREGMLHGGDTGPAVSPGKPEDSLILDAIGYKDPDLQMPPKGSASPTSRWPTLRSGSGAARRIRAPWSLAAAPRPTAAWGATTGRSSP